jgi:hypothetical protein
LNANGNNNKGRIAVARANRIDHIDLKLFEMRPATGMVKEPTIGTKTVSMVIVSIFIKIIHYIQNKKFVNTQNNISLLSIIT